MKFNAYYSHIHLIIEQCVKRPLIGGMPYRHVEVLDQERTHHLIQNEKRKKSTMKMEKIKLIQIIEIIEIINIIKIP